MKIHVCPYCGGRTFATVAHVTQTWVVDEKGNFLKEQTSCDEVLNEPDNGNIWTCTTCGSEAVVAETVSLDTADAVEKLQDVLDDCTLELKQDGVLYEAEAESFSLDSYETAQRLMQAMGISGKPFAVIEDNGPVLVYIDQTGPDVKYHDWQPYITHYRQVYDQCLIDAGEEDPDDVTAGADRLFSENADADAVVGSLLLTYGDNALNQFYRVLDKACELSERNKEVRETLVKLFK